MLTEGDSISLEDLPENIQGGALPLNTYGETGETLFDIEKEHILKVLHEKQLNKTLTAEALGISLKTLYNKLKLYQIDL